MVGRRKPSNFAVGTLGWDETLRCWILSPIVVLADVYGNRELCEKYNLKPPPLKVTWYQCRGCPGQVFRSLSQFSTHCQSSHTYRCEICNETVATQLAMDFHLENHTHDGHCPKCTDTSLDDSQEFRRHILHHGIIGHKTGVEAKSHEMPVIEYMGSLGTSEITVISDTEDENDPTEPRVTLQNGGTRTIKSSELRMESDTFRVKASCRCRMCQSFFPSVIEAYNHLKDKHPTSLTKDDKILGRVKMKVKIIKVSRSEVEEQVPPPAEKSKQTQEKPKPLIRVRTNLFEDRDTSSSSPSTTTKRVLRSSLEPQQRNSASAQRRTPKSPGGSGKIIKASEVLQLHPTTERTTTPTDFIPSSRPRNIKCEPPASSFDIPLIPIPELIPPPPPPLYRASASTADDDDRVSVVVDHQAPDHPPPPPLHVPAPVPHNLRIVSVSSAGGPVFDDCPLLPPHPPPPQATTTTNDVIAIDDEDETDVMNAISQSPVYTTSTRHNGMTTTTSLSIPRQDSPGVPKNLIKQSRMNGNAAKKQKLLNESIYQVFEL